MAVQPTQTCDPYFDGVASNKAKPFNPKERRRGEEASDVESSVVVAASRRDDIISMLSDTTIVDCAPCPLGTYRTTLPPTDTTTTATTATTTTTTTTDTPQQQKCLTCPSGKYYLSTVDKCVPSPPGSAAVKALAYFDSNNEEDILSWDRRPGWASSCSTSGDCPSRYLSSLPRSLSITHPFC